MIEYKGVCLRCGKPFSALKQFESSRERVFCTKSCSSAYSQAEIKKRYAEGGDLADLMIPCKECGTMFHPTYPSLVYCSTKCSRASRKKYQREYFQNNGKEEQKQAKVSLLDQVRSPNDYAKLQMERTLQMLKESRK